MRNTVILIVVLLVLGGGFFFIQSSQKSKTQPTPTPPTANTDSMEQIPTAETSPSSEEAMMQEDTEGTVKEFTVEGANFSFTPKELTVNKGDTVRITFKNAEGFHDLKIDEFKVATQKLAAGKEETVKFIADKAGTFEYYCSVGNHRQQGMVGTLTVK